MVHEKNVVHKYFLLFVLLEIDIPMFNQLFRLSTAYSIERVYFKVTISNTLLVFNWVALLFYHTCCQHIRLEPTAQYGN